jgi:hypothetical protein
MGERFYSLLACTRIFSLFCFDHLIFRPEFICDADVLASTIHDTWLTGAQTEPLPQLLASIQAQVSKVSSSFISPYFARQFGLGLWSHMKTPFLCGATATLADIAVWARLRTSASLPKPVKVLAPSYKQPFLLLFLLPHQVWGDRVSGLPFVSKAIGQLPL